MEGYVNNKRILKLFRNAYSDSKEMYTPLF